MKFLQAFLSSAHPLSAIAGFGSGFVANPKESLGINTTNMDAGEVVCPSA